MSHSAEKASTGHADGLSIYFPHYCSDGPGYSGPVTFRVMGDKVTTSTSKEVVELSLPIALSNVVGVREVAKDDLPYIKANLDDAAREYLQDPDGEIHIDPDRVKILSCEDGSMGFFIVHGEVCHFDFMCGVRRFSVSEKSIFSY